MPFKTILIIEHVFILLCQRALADGTSYPPPTTYTYSDFTWTITPAPTPSAIIALPPDPSGIAEVDIVFPRDGGNYPQLEPFPVIFALQQPQILYKYGFDISWTLSPLATCDYDSDDFPDCLETPYGEISSGVGYTGFPIPDVIGKDPIFAYDNGTGLTPGVWELFWQFDISRNCDDLYIVIEVHQSGVVANGTLTFTIDETAPKPTIASSCPEVAGLVNYWGTISATLAGGDIFEGCPETLSSPPPASATPCAATLNDAQASSISAALGISIALITPTLPPTSLASFTPISTSTSISRGLQTSVTLTSGEFESTDLSNSGSAAGGLRTSTLTVTPSATTSPSASSRIKNSLPLAVILVLLCVICLALL